MDGPHLASVLKGAAEHKGSVFVEVFQNCPVFNDGAYDFVTDKAVKAEAQLRMEQGRPLLFGKENRKGIRFDPQTALAGGRHARRERRHGEADILVHDATREDPAIAYMLANLSVGRASRRRSGSSAMSGALPPTR